jgi:hypothetical protein
MPSSVPIWVNKEMGHVAGEFLIEDSAMDGNCFFDSIRIILESVGVYKTVEDLRKVVALSVKDPTNRIVNDTIATWWELFSGAKKERNLELIHEYLHMRYLPDDLVLPLSDENRETLYQTMLTTNYWGEQHACRIIEEQTRLRFLIFQGDMQKPSVCWYHSRGYKPEYYCFLYNSNQHYMPVSFRGKFIYKWDELPTDVQLFFSKVFVPPTNQQKTSESSSDK